MLDEAGKAIADGYRVLYLKCGLDGARRSRNASQPSTTPIGPEPLLRLDPNEAWSPGQAVRMARLLEPYGIDFLEQPVASRDLDGLARVRASSNIPIAAEPGSVHATSTSSRCSTRDAADVIVTGPHQAGGIMPVQEDRRHGRDGWSADQPPRRGRASESAQPPGCRCARPSRISRSATRPTTSCSRVTS